MARFSNNIGAAAATLLPLLITLLITAKLTGAPLAAAGGAECRGGGTVGECMESGGEEFLMDSETSRRLLSGNPGKKNLVYPQLEKPQPCQANRYGSCLADQVGVKMNCNWYNKSCVKP